MTETDVRRRVQSFRRQFLLKEVTADSLMEVFRKQGFTVIEFNPVVNDEDVSTVIRNLGLEEMIRKSSGFLYTDSLYRLVFLNEKLTEEEKLLVLAHEEGHYYCGHTQNGSIIGRNVAEEYEANEFAHYLLRGTAAGRLKKSAAKHKKGVLIGAAALALIGGGGAAVREYREQVLYEGTYYVTVHGEKYHLENCVTIQGHETRRLTKEDIESGRYEPCSVCMPDQQ